MIEKKDSTSNTFETFVQFRKMSKNTSTFKIILDAKKRFSEIDLMIGAIIEKNTNENLDKAFNQKLKTTKKVQAQKPLSSDYMKPQTNQYLAAATLPSLCFWETIKQKTNESDEKTIQPFNQLIWNEPFSLPEFTKERPFSEANEFVKIGNYIFAVNKTLILGLNQHTNNLNIFFVVSPNNGYLHRAIKENLSEAELMKKINQYGRDYLSDVIDCVKQKVNPTTKISCIVLGDRELQENMDAYDPWLLVNSEAADAENIEHYFMPKEGVTVFNIDASGHEMSITSADLETLYKIAMGIQKKDGTGEAIIVHCQQGLDRTGMLIFAMTLFENYNAILLSKNNTDKMYDTYKELQRSRSPVALTKVADFVNAIYLAHTLVAIDLEKKCISNLDKSNNDLILQLNEAKSTAKKLEIIEKELEQVRVMENSLSKTQKSRPRSASCSTKPEMVTIDGFKKSSSSPEDLNIKENLNFLEHKYGDSEPFPVKNSSGFFSKKSKKHLSASLKELNLQPKNYERDLNCCRNALQHRMNTEKELQNRIQPKQTINNSSMIL